MRICYKKLWHILIDKGMNKQDLKDVAGISTASIAKLGRGENVQTKILLKICIGLNVGINDIMETVTDDSAENKKTSRKAGEQV